MRRAGHGGVPLLLLHGFPCTSLIWSRNLEPLAAAGFDVAAPDLRGYGDSDLAPDGFYDPAAFSADLTDLLEAFGWAETVVAGHDLGAVVAIGLANRHPGRIKRLVLFNHPPPAMPEAYRKAGIPDSEPKPAVFDYAARQGLHADELAAELDTPGRRRRYIAEFYGHRLWCPPNAFTEDDLALLVEPFADGDRLRASFADYEVVQGRRPVSAPDLHDRPVRQPVLVSSAPTTSPWPSTWCSAARWLTPTSPARIWSPMPATTFNGSSQRWPIRRSAGSAAICWPSRADDDVREQCPARTCAALTAVNARGR